jgi:N-acetyl-anhydromuramyl-L-alanine amidase AmpD
MTIDMIEAHYISTINLDQNKWAYLGLILGMFGQYSISAHYLIERDGRVIELVSSNLEAWHTGKSSWEGIAH